MKIFDVWPLISWPSLLNTSAACSKSCFFQSVIWSEWTWYRSESSRIVWFPFSASNATLALNAGAWFLLVFTHIWVLLRGHYKSNFLTYAPVQFLPDPLFVLPTIQCKRRVIQALLRLASRITSYTWSCWFHFEFSFRYVFLEKNWTSGFELERWDMDFKPPAFDSGPK